MTVRSRPTLMLVVQSLPDTAMDRPGNSPCIFSGEISGPRFPFGGVRFAPPPLPGAWAFLRALRRDCPGWGAALPRGFCGAGR